MLGVLLDVELATELATELLIELIELVELVVAVLDDDLLDEDGTVVPVGIEHSFTPPATRGPKTASEQTKLPDKVL